MGFFAALFGSEKRDSTELELEGAYSITLAAMGIPRQEASRIARDTVQKAKELVKQRKQEQEPPNLGDQLIENASIDPGIRARLDALRSEGVTDEDFRDWWNRPPLERAMLELNDESTRMGLFVTALKCGASPEEAGAAVRRRYEEFGELDPNQGDDGPIPWELRARITKWNESNGKTMAGEIERSSSFNALVRREMRNGRL